jgi:hypothetical protein
LEDALRQAQRNREIELRVLVMKMDDAVKEGRVFD